MIADKITNINRYAGIPDLKKVIAFIQSTDLNTLPDGRTDIDGDNLYVNIQHPQLRSAEGARPEAHDCYADLQLVLEGCEVMGYIPRDTLGEPCEANPEGDIFLYQADSFASVPIEAGMFAVFFPEDAHAPGLAGSDKGPVKKAVFKIRLDGSNCSQSR